MLVTSAASVMIPQVIPVKRARWSKGISLIELLVVLAVVALLALLALPAVEDTIGSGRRATGLMDAMGMVAGARSHAISRHLPVALCPSSDQLSCNSENWEEGWLMFVDDGDGGIPRDGNRSKQEEILRVGPAANGEVTIRSHNFSDPGAIVFDELGMASERGTLMICDEAGKKYAKAAVLDISGEARIASGDPTLASCQDCILKQDIAGATCP